MEEGEEQTECFFKPHASKLKLIPNNERLG